MTRFVEHCITELYFSGLYIFDYNGIEYVCGYDLLYGYIATRYKQII